tara:strand:+ start:336 stop:767 length:432 start_codon:yes stop_codon:yes gene_type:complete
LKEQICHYVLQLLNQKIINIRKIIFSIQKARNNEIKSSAGDKYETGRVMMQNELEKQFLLLQQYQNQKANILKIQKMKTSEKIGFGSLVLTNQGNYLIAIGIGKVDKFSVISLLSPLGKAFRGLKSGDTFIFQNKEYKIKSVK